MTTTSTASCGRALLRIGGRCCSTESGEVVGLAHRALARALDLANRTGASRTKPGTVLLDWPTLWDPPLPAGCRRFCLTSSTEPIPYARLTWDQAAWLASRRGVDFLVHELIVLLAASPERAVEFLEGVADSCTEPLSRCWTASSARCVDLRSAWDSASLSAGPHQSAQTPRVSGFPMSSFHKGLSRRHRGVRATPQIQGSLWTSRTGARTAEPDFPQWWLDAIDERDIREAKTHTEPDFLRWRSSGAGIWPTSAASRLAPPDPVPPPDEGPAGLTTHRRPRIANPLDVSWADADSPESEVSTGFCQAPNQRGLPRNLPLATGTPYWFFVQVGPERALDGIDDWEVSRPLPPLPPGVELQVVVSNPPGGLQTDPTRDVGHIRMGASGVAAAIVSQTGAHSVIASTSRFEPRSSPGRTR